MSEGGNPLQHVFLAGAIFAIVSFMLYYNAQVDKHRLPATTASGKLVFSRTLQTTTKYGDVRRTLTFGLTGFANEFRVDPKYVDALLNNTTPAELRAGAEVVADVSAAELATPSQPGSRPDLSIVWVYGLQVDGRSLFSMPETNRVDREDKRIGWLMLALSGAYVLGAFAYWVRKRA